MLQKIRYKVEGHTQGDGVPPEGAQMHILPVGVEGVDAGTYSRRRGR